MGIATYPAYARTIPDKQAGHESFDHVVAFVHGLVA